MMAVVSGACAFSGLSRTSRVGARPLVYAVQCQKRFYSTSVSYTDLYWDRFQQYACVPSDYRIARRHGVLAHFSADDLQLCYTVRSLVRGDETDIAGRVEACVGDIRRWMLAKT